MKVSERHGFLTLEERHAVSVEEMSKLETDGEKLGISKLIMMENAGSSIAKLVSELSPAGKARVCLFAGTGNNGGDVFVTARHLSYWFDRFELELCLVGRATDIRSVEARTNWNVLCNIGTITKRQINSVEELSSVRNSLGTSDFVIIGIFGTGFHGIPRDPAKSLIQMINECSKPTKISVDVPSGLEADSGNFQVAVKSDYTITMHAPKRGLLAESAKQICGNILIANIGLPQ